MALRSRFNPLRNLTFPRLIRQLESFEAGYLQEAALTWDAQERRNIYLGNVAAKRKKAVARLPWEIRKMDDSRMATRQAEVLTEFWNSIRVSTVLQQDERGGLSLLIRQMMDAVGKRFAVHEIVWKPGAALQAEFHFCPLWWFENSTGKLRFLPEDGLLQGEEMADGEWLVTVGEGIMEGCSILDVLRGLPLKDWAAFSEKFGMPGVLGKTGAAVDSKEWKAMETAVQSLMNDWAAVASQSDTIELLETKSGGTNLPFPPLLEYCDRAIAARWRGADLSTISQGNEGVGASLQGDDTDLILEDDAAMITEALNERVDRYVIEYVFGPETEIKAYFKLKGESEDEAATTFKRELVKACLADPALNAVVANLIDLKALFKEVAVPVDEDYIEPFLPVLTRQGYPVNGNTILDSEGDIVGGDMERAPANGDEETGQPGADEEPIQAANQKPAALVNTLPRSGPSPNPSALRGAARFSRSARSDLAVATRNTFKPLAERLQAVFRIENPLEQRVALQELLRDFPALEQTMNASPNGPANTEALEQAIASAFLNGRALGAQTRKKS
jgi:hypothetical protein